MNEINYIQWYRVGGTQVRCTRAQCTPPNTAHRIRQSITALRSPQWNQPACSVINERYTRAKGKAALQPHNSLSICCSCRCSFINHGCSPTCRHAHKTEPQYRWLVREQNNRAICRCFVTLSTAAWNNRLIKSLLINSSLAVLKIRSAVGKRIT